MKGMRILVVGGGAREHALTWKISQSPLVSKEFCAPGNAGTATIAENLPISAKDITNLVRAVKEKEIDGVVVGPEDPLDSGIVDRLQEMGIPAFGPTTAATRIESSKIFSRKIMEKYGIPCPNGVIFYDYEFTKAEKHLMKCSLPIVIKADGLAAGKGVEICEDRKRAQEVLTNFMIERTLHDRGNGVIIDEYLKGKEVSLIAFTDGETVVPMVTACDYKKIYEGDRGPNTGGMGSYSPSEFLTRAEIKKICKTILEPTVWAMAEEKRPYKGALYAGLIITPDGQTKVLEFNARFGDPETQVQIPLLKTALVDIILAVINGTLHQIKIEWLNEFCVGVVMASEGYPGTPKKGLLITGLDKVDSGILIFHAGTKIDRDDQIITDGGRVLTVTATGKTMVEARDKAYANFSRIHFDGCQYRRDIAARAC
jgi:phosphoribosylamine--glycine ligase